MDSVTFSNRKTTADWTEQALNWTEQILKLFYLEIHFEPASTTANWREIIWKYRLKFIQYAGLPVMIQTKAIQNKGLIFLKTSKITKYW